MTIDELAFLRRREARRLAESQPYSPEWDAARAAIDDFDDELRALGKNLDGPARRGSKHARARSQHGDP
jgi:hypothetical protein